MENYICLESVKKNENFGCEFFLARFKVYVSSRKLDTGSDLIRLAKNHGLIRLAKNDIILSQKTNFIYRSGAGHCISEINQLARPP